MTSHLEDGILQELLDGEVHSSALPPIQAHLAACAECRARLEAARSYMSEADELIEMLDDPPVRAPVAVTPLPVRKPEPWTRRLAWAASLVIAVGAGYYSRGEVLVPVLQQPTPTQELAAIPQPTTAPLVSEQAIPSAPLREIRSPMPAVSGAGADQGARQELAAKALSQAAPERAVGRATAGAPPAASPPPVASAENRAESELARARRDAAVPRDQADGLIMGEAGGFPISFPDAVRLLGGTLRLVEGLVPLRLESIGTTVRVIYPVAQGELVLSQSVTNGIWTVRLTGPTKFPSDSLAVLRGRIRD